MKNINQTIVSQYGNAPTLQQLIYNFNQYIDPSTDLDAFYDNVFNIETAVGFGLDYWGKIVGVTRNITAPSSGPFFGFDEGAGQPFGQASFYSAQSASGVYTLADGAFRTLILVKALANISNGSSPGYNQLLQNLFAGRGRCYVNDLGNMQMRFCFEFTLEPYELAIVTQSGAFPRPAAVQAFAIQVDTSKTLGFHEAGIYQPFGYGTFGSGEVNVA